MSKVVESVKMIRDCANNNSWQGERLGGMSENDYSIFEYNVKDNDIKTKMFHLQGAGGADECQHRPEVSYLL